MFATKHTVGATGATHQQSHHGEQVGKYDSNIEFARNALVEAQEKYAEAVVAMANAAPGVRQYVLDMRQRDIDEANMMIETFTRANLERG